MKLNGLNEFSDKDLMERLSEERQMLKNMKFQHAVSGLESPNQLKVIRKNIARLMTEINGRSNNK